MINVQEHYERSGATISLTGQSEGKSELVRLGAGSSGNKYIISIVLLSLELDYFSLLV